MQNLRRGKPARAAIPRELFTRTANSGLTGHLSLGFLRRLAGWSRSLRRVPGHRSAWSRRPGGRCDPNPPEHRQDCDSPRRAGCRLDVHVTIQPSRLRIAQEPQGGRMDELGSGPQPLTRKSSSGLIVNQADRIEVVGHGHNSAAHGPQGQI